MRKRESNNLSTHILAKPPSDSGVRAALGLMAEPQVVLRKGQEGVRDSAASQ